MSGYDSASRDAFSRVDVTAGQARVLQAFAPGAQHTRQELVALTGMPINAICGRCKELIDAGKLESLPTVGGRHPLRLKNAAGRNLHDGIASSWRATDAIDLRPESAPAAPDTSSESHRHTCEVQYVAAMKSDNERRLFLQGVREKRGDAAYMSLRADVWALLQRVAA